MAETTTETKKVKKELTEEEKKKLAEERKAKEQERFEKASELFQTANKITSIDAKKIVLGSSKWKVTPSELAELLEKKLISEDTAALIREFKLVKSYQTKSTGDELPYNWKSFRIFTEGDTERNIPGNKDLEAKLVTLSGLVDKFYEDNDTLLTEIESITAEERLKHGEPSEDASNGAVLMNYFRFGKASKKKEGEDESGEETA